jgi:hypothetical protein
MLQVVSKFLLNVKKYILVLLMYFLIKTKILKIFFLYYWNSSPEIKSVNIKIDFLCCQNQC